jgi:hypothetical protein
MGIMGTPYLIGALRQDLRYFQNSGNFRDTIPAFLLRLIIKQGVTSLSPDFQILDNKANRRVLTSRVPHDVTSRNYPVSCTSVPFRREER